MTSGGDERILLDPTTGINRYLVAPRPMIGISYSSSTANPMSNSAMSEVKRRLATLAPNLELSGDEYGAALELIRQRLRASIGIPASVQIVFAASGTDLEYVGLAVANRAGAKGIDNILLGIDEVGSGCMHSASGNHFADRTPLGIVVKAGQPLCLEDALKIRLVDVSIRSNTGLAIESEDVLLAIAAAIEAAIAAERTPLVHVVHGSKTGLILPSLAHIDALRRRFGSKICFVVDACQFRISRDMIAAYLSRGCVVFLTGSKFVGGPPFSGFALVPETTAQQSQGLLSGSEKIFAQGEWPESWAGKAKLKNAANLGLLLRLEASLYEIELYHKLTSAEIKRTLDHFEQAVNALTRRLGISRVAPRSYASADGGEIQPLEMRTLVTLDLSSLDDNYDFDFARKMHKALASPSKEPTVRDLFPVRLGQPAKCTKLADARYGGNVRIGLSMPQMVEFATMDSASLQRTLMADMELVANRIERYLRFEV